MTDAPPTPAAELPPAPPCHVSGCTAAVQLVYRVSPYGARTIWDAIVRDVAACGAHLAAAKAQGTVIGARALADAVVVRTVAP